LLGWALVSAWRKRLPIAGPLALAAGILAVAMVGRINIGVRHVLPIYAPLSVICAVAAADALRGPVRRALPMFALLAWQAISSAAQHPDYLAYTNEITGSHPEKFVADSDLDWGQDMKIVAAFLARHGAIRIAFTPYCDSYFAA